MAIVWRPGQIIKNGRFKVLKDLGSGGFGTTYQVRELKSQQMKDVAEPRLLALKILNSKQQGRADFSEQQERFMNEAMNLKGFDAHPNIVKVLEVVEVVESSEFNGQRQEERVWGMLMEWIDGEDLEVYVDRRRLPEKEALQYIEQIGAALIYVHSKDVLHRDVKPSNVLLEKSLAIGASRRPVLIDFGLAREFISNKTMDASNIGTQFYAPIEQYDRKFQPGEYRQVRLGKYTDVYALAATLYNLLTDQPPVPACYRRSNSGGDMLPSPQSFNSQISDRINQTILRGMALDYGDRPQSIEEFLALLKPPVPIVIPDPIIPQEIPKMSARTEPAVVQQPAVVKPPVKQVVPVQPERPKATPKPAADPVVKQQPRPQVPQDPPQQKAPVKELLPQRDRIPAVADRPLISRRSLLYGGLVFVGGAGAIALWPKSNETVVPIAQRGRAKTFTEDLGNGVKLEMVEIPKGEFMMGSPSSEQDRSADEGPQHRVQVPGFYMGKYEVTQAQYQALMGKNPSHFTGDGKLPVEQVSWLDAMDFCQKLSQKTGRTYRLPSEAEWEYACRAGTTTPFAFGETISAAIVNYDGNYPYGNAAKGEYREKTTSVGSFPANAFGLHDMHGNLWEWCLDEWMDNYNNAPVDGSPRGDIKSRANDKQRLLRGGSWNYYADDCRSADRLHSAASNRLNYVGFRLLAVAPRTF
jgi:formylglycine-generating enzyme required for sulfatase activity